MNANLDTAIATVRDISTYSIAANANVDAAIYGEVAQFVDGIRDEVLENAEYFADIPSESFTDHFEYNGLDHEIADSAIPVYTADVWELFSELSAWEEDVTELGPVEDMLTGAQTAIYMIALRVVSAVLTELDKETEEKD